jgi:Ran GTPase-activating protein 1
VQKITLGGNSYGFEACEWVAQTLAKTETPALKAIDFSNIFVSRLRAELPKSLKVMAEALLPKCLTEVDLSDNAFGPDGVRAFECLLTTGESLKIFKVTNCGLGPQGAEMIAEAMSMNTDLQLTHFHAGRDRLENKGIEALSAVIAK